MGNEKAREAFSPFKRRKTARDVIESFGESTSAHGVPKIISAGSATAGFVWTFVTVSALALFIFQGSNLVRHFFIWPTTTKLDIVTESYLDFPAVTICNMNKLRRSSLKGTRFETLIEIDGGFADSQYDWWFDWSSSSSEDTSQESSSEPMSSLSSTGSDHGAGNSDVSKYSTQSSVVTGSTVPVEASTSMPGPSASPDGSPQASSELGASSSNVPQTDEPSLSASYESTAGPGRRRRRRRAVKRRKKRDTVNSDSSLSDSSYSYNFWERHFQSFTDVRTDFEFYDYYDFTDVINDEDWWGFYRGMTGNDFSVWNEIVSPTQEELKTFGHQASDFIKQCTFDKKACNSTNFRQFQNTEYGNCYTFNHATGTEIPRRTSKTGSQHGLHLTLFVEQPEYIGLFSPETGVRVTVNSPYVVPFPEDDGMTVAPGMASSLGIRQSWIRRLPLPYGNCTDGSNSNFTYTDFLYSKRACLKSCFQSHLMKTCGCVTDFSLNKSLCSILNSTQQRCKQIVQTIQQEDKLECVCPTPCQEVNYIRTMTSSLWPSERYEKFLVSSLSQNNSRIGSILSDVTLTRKNLVRLRIYFEELNYESVEQTPLYTVETLLGGVGGLMGLYVGLSVISLFEIMVFVGSLIKTVFNWMTSTKVRPVNRGG